MTESSYPTAVQLMRRYISVIITLCSICHEPLPSLSRTLRLLLKPKLALYAQRTSGVELHELEVLQRQPRPRDHGVAVACASVRRRRAEIRAPVTAGRQDCLRRTEPAAGSGMRYALT